MVIIRNNRKKPKILRRVGDEIIKEMKKILSLIAVAAIAVSCGNKNSAQDSSFIQEQAAIEDVTTETVVNSVGEANAARFTLENGDEIVGVVMEPGNMATAVVHSPEIGKLLLQYKLTLMTPFTSEEEATIIIVPKSFEKGMFMGTEDEYKLTDLELLKISKVEERGVEESVAKDFIKKMYNESLFENEQFLLKHCSPELLNELREEIDGVETYEPYLFGFYQDGVSDRHEITKVESLGDNWYRYDFYDKGVKGACRIKLVLNPDNVITISTVEFIEQAE